MCVRWCASAVKLNPECSWPLKDSNKLIILSVWGPCWAGRLAKAWPWCRYGPLAVTRGDGPLRRRPRSAERSASRCQQSDICVSQTKLLRTNLHCWTAQHYRITWPSMLASFSTSIDLHICMSTGSFCPFCTFVLLLRLPISKSMIKQKEWILLVTSRNYSNLSAVGNGMRNRSEWRCLWIFSFPSWRPVTLRLDSHLVSAGVQVACSNRLLGKLSQPINVTPWAGGSS